MGNRLWFSGEEISKGGPRVAGIDEAHHVHFFFVPPRPADLCITLDPVSRETNAMAGTCGPLTWSPYTLCLHIFKSEQSDTYRNLLATKECAIAFPTKEQVRETWILNMGLPRGIDELAVARLTPLPSQKIAPPGIAECPVNLECVVEFHRDYYTHGIFFCRVIGGSIAEEIIAWPRERAMNLYPTYEVDDIQNRWGGDVERLGVLGELYETPRFPVGVKEGWWYGLSLDGWVQQLTDEGHLSEDEGRQMIVWRTDFGDAFADLRSPHRAEARAKLTRACELIAWEEWEALRAHLREG
jgi:flavin reductase (DIM6/NTAB) family NADH-FMN oxidoreductase RutF